MIPAAKRLELSLWSALPGIVTLLLLILFLLPKHIAGLDRFMPVLPVIPIFYWGMMHAREMPYWFVFLLGLAMDGVTGAPLGLTSFLYLLSLILLHRQRRALHKEGFIAKWGYFALLLALIASAHWLILLIFQGSAPPVAYGFVQWLLTVCCYPAFHAAFDALSHYIHTRRWQLLHWK